MSTKQPKATATFNQDGTQVTITVEGQESKTFNTQLGALNYGQELIDSKTVDEDSLWKAREVIIGAKDLPVGTEEEINKAKAAFFEEIAPLLGAASVTVIGVSVKKRSSPNDADLKMKKPIFRMCDCGINHGNVVDEETGLSSQDLGSKEAAIKWIDFATKNGNIKPEDVDSLKKQVNEQDKLVATEAEFLKSMENAFQGA